MRGLGIGSGFRAQASAVQRRRIPVWVHMLLRAHYKRVLRRKQVVAFVRSDAVRRFSHPNGDAPVQRLGRVLFLQAPWHVLGFLAFSSLIAPQLQAEVFWRQPKQADTVLQQLGGTCVYTTGVQLNGAPGALAAYSFGSSAAEVRAGLTHSLGLPPGASFGGTLLAHAEKDRMRRLFVLPAASGESACVVLLFDQSLRDFARASRESPAWPAGLPAVDAVPLFSAVCTETHTTFAVGETASDPATAAQEAALALRRAGWLEASAPSATATFKMFSSGKKVCLLFASRRPQTERTTISVLQREGATP